MTGSETNRQATSSPSPAPDGSADDTFDETTREDMRARRLRLARNILLGLIGAVVAVWAVLFITKGRFLRAPFESAVGRLTGRDVRVAGDFQLYLAPFDLRLVTEGLTVSNPDWAARPDLLRAQRIDARFVPLTLMFGRLRLRALDIDGATAALEWRADHGANSWTFGDGGDGEPLRLPRIDRARVAATRLHYADPRMRLAVEVAFDTVRSDDARIGRAIRFGGGGQLRETPMRVAGALLSPDETVSRGRNRLRLLVEAAGNRIGVAGTLPGIADVERVPLGVRAEGGDIADLLGIIGVAVPQSRRYGLTATLVKSGDMFRFTDMVGRFGDSDIAGTLAITNAEPRVHVRADLATRRLDIVDVAPFIGYNPDLVATRGAQAAVGQAGGSPRILPDARLRIDALANFDADVRYRVGTVRSRRVPISAIDLTVKLENRLLTLSPLVFEMARGRVSADVTIDARARPVDTRYDVRLAQTPMGRLLAGFGVAESGTTGTLGGRAQLRGRGDTVRASLGSATGRIALVMPRGTLWTRNVELSELDIGTFVQRMFEGRLEEPVEIHCGLVAFTVRNGVATADPILIDTRKNVVTGRGGFSFGTEQVDLAFRADSKRFSLFSGQSPVALRGAFASPAINPITPELLGRAGAALGIAAVLSPPAALLAFVDPGDAEAAACGPVLRGARASEQRTEDGEPRRDVRTESNKSDEPRRERRRFLGIF